MKLEHVALVAQVGQVELGESSAQEKGSVTTGPFVLTNPL